MAEDQWSHLYLGHATINLKDALPRETAYTVCVLTYTDAADKWPNKGFEY